MLTQDAQENSVETIDSFLLKILNTTRNINICVKTIVLHVIKFQQHGIEVSCKNL